MGFDSTYSLCAWPQAATSKVNVSRGNLLTLRLTQLLPPAVGETGQINRTGQYYIILILIPTHNNIILSIFF